jgi:hypothetical protein
MEYIICPCCGSPDAVSGWSGDMILEFPYILCDCGYYDEDGEVKQLRPEDVPMKRAWLKY